MADKALKQCNKFGCFELTRNGYCEEHQYIADEKAKERHKYYQKYRDDIKEQDFYKTPSWRNIRERAITRDKGLCQYCLANKKIVSAQTVHHIKPIKKHWELRLTLSNLISLCDTCHNEIDHSKL